MRLFSLLAAVIGLSLLVGCASGPSEEASDQEHADTHPEIKMVSKEKFEKDMADLNKQEGGQQAQDIKTLPDPEKRGYVNKQANENINNMKQSGSDTVAGTMSDEPLSPQAQDQIEQASSLGKSSVPQQSLQEQQQAEMQSVRAQNVSNSEADQAGNNMPIKRAAVNSETGIQNDAAPIPVVSPDESSPEDANAGIPQSPEDLYYRGDITAKRQQTVMNQLADS